MEMTPAETAASRFPEVYPTSATPTVAVAPGRVNLIGEHTDYNDGFVLPMAIDANVAVAFSARVDGVLRAYSVVFEESRQAATRDLEAPGGTGWFDYVAAVAWAMRESGMPVSGIDMVIAGNVPVGAGLASSAALEMAAARALCHAGSVEWEPQRLARVGQRGENEYVGVNCGIMDQFASAVCEDDRALLLDCKTLDYSFVPIPQDASIVVMDTGVRRSLAASEYNERRSSCETAVAVLQQLHPKVGSLRDVDQEMLASAGKSLSDRVLRRAQHVVSEMPRPAQLGAALASGDLEQAGKLMDESHASLRDLYEVSCRELDLITTLARDHEACFGARMTGAGFGGCAVALVEQGGASRFVSDVAAAYAAAGGVNGAMYVCRPSAGAAILEARL
jgi:galactokinase